MPAGRELRLTEAAFLFIPNGLIRCPGIASMFLHLRICHDE